MELVEGQTLAERIAGGPIPVQEALKIALQIVGALEAAHEKGIIHRDLKPANVKITPDGKVKVLDFGLAKALDAAVPSEMDRMNSPTLSLAATSAGVILGTAGYMSPEQAKGRNADQRSDIFSFSAVLYEMITGRSTFDGETVTDVIAAVLKQDGSGGALFWQRADGSGTADELAERPPGPGYGPTAVSPDGKTLLFRSGINGGDIWKLSLEGAHEPESLISSVSDQRDGYFSPDGRWIVYTSSETGQPEVFVQPFPPTGEKHKITSTGATAPLWSPDGKQILYTSFTGPVRQLLSVDVRTQPSFGFSNPIELPIDNIAARGSMLRPYDIAPDGKEFVVIIPDSDVPAMQTQIHITLNWFEDLK